MARDVQRSSSCSVDRGLYVLRYVSSDSTDVAPSAFIGPAAGSESSLRFIDAPGLPAGMLSGPGASIVIVSEGYAKVEITVRASESSRVLDAKFALELLSKGGEEAVASPVKVEMPSSSTWLPPALPKPFDAGRGAMPNTPAEPTLALPIMDILAHVSRRGDIMVTPGEWVAGPDAPTPVEGVQITCRGADLAVSARFMNTTQPGVWSSWWSAGDFVGSRQQASPLTGLRLKLVGRDASRFELEAEAMFLGKPLQRHTGSEVSLATAGGLDLLVGLKLGLRSVARQEEAAVLKQQASPAVKSSRVRVFRSDRADLVNS